MTEIIKIVTLPVGESAADISKLLVELGACSSRSQAKRLIKEGAVSIDGKTISSPIASLPPEDPVIKCGKWFFMKLIMPRKSFRVLVDADTGTAKILEEVR